jgi:hypothetical protein
MSLSGGFMFLVVGELAAARLLKRSDIPLPETVDVP